MELRSPSPSPSSSRSAAVTSGPGRAPASDGRARHRRPAVAGTARGTGPGLRPGGREIRRGHRLRGGRDRDASAEELRRRAEVLFGEGAGRGTRGVGGVGPAPARRVPSWAGSGVDESVARSRRGPAAARGDVDVGEVRTSEEVFEPVASDPVMPGERRPAGRVGLALRERLPLWVRTRCGLERRSVVALSVVLVLAVGFAAQHFWAGRTQPVRAPEVVGAAVPQVGDGAGSTPAASAGAAGEAAGTSTGAGAAGTVLPEIVVDVGGKVRDPGVHRLPAGSRVADALRAAGGVRPGARTDGLNRARFLVDGEQVIVGGPAPAPGAGPAPAAGGPAGVAPGAGPTTPLSLNTATLDQLDSLPGVGPVLARHILDHRTRNGGFRSVDELREVNGIGDRRFADLRNLVRP
ncbi:helix-hairpin-helix domain-containing protein [Streptomyces sp. NPDC058632]|uniref:helix-hairpin-helix domain-containing protein n=1 Tax=unclassified Streptomyces TaxID=2593676 RepID=UPI00364AE2DA